MEQQHRHRAGDLKQQNKGFKSGKHDSKGAIKRRSDGKVEQRKSVKASAVVPNRQQIMRLKQMKATQTKKEESLNRRRLGLPDLVAPRIVSIISLCDKSDTSKVRQMLLKSKYNGDMIDDGNMGTTLCLGQAGKVRATILECQSRNLNDSFEYVKIADITLFVLDVSEHIGHGFHDTFEKFDEVAERLISIINAQGVPSSMLLLQGLDKVQAKRRNDVKKAVTQVYHSRFTGEPKVLSLDTDEDTNMVLRYIESMHVNEILWKNMRPYIYVEKVLDAPNNSLVIEGYIRGNNMNAQQLIYIPEFGDYQISKIERALDPNMKQHKGNAMSDDNQIITSSKPEERESLESVNIPDINEQEQTMPTNEEIEMATKRVKVPKGTSEYQASWYLDMEEEEQDIDEDEDDDEDDEFQDVEDQMNGEDMEVGKSNGEDNEMDNDEDEENGEDGEEEEVEEIELGKNKWEGKTKSDYLQMLREEQEKNADQDREEEQKEYEFPDEAEAPVNFPARIRFAKYRGLKSFRSSPWDSMENLPLDYARIFQFHSYNQSMKKAMEIQYNSPAKIDTYVRITVENAPTKAQLEQTTKSTSSGNTLPLIITGMLKYENKVSVLHFQLEKHRTYEEPVKSKQLVYFHCGFRKYATRPLYSLSAPNCDKQKFEKYLLDGRNAMATIYAPIMFVPAPLVVFEDNECNNLIATGRLVSVNPDRIITKRIILTGAVSKAISRKFVTVRDMFYFPEDIIYFKKVELYSKMGRIGNIKESLGTHGYMKCLFDGTMSQMDIICMNLYKRVYPKWLFDNNGKPLLQQEQDDNKMN